ncbi:MAG: hypothetical protein AB1521_10050 [Bacteroidota bacterium]
MNKSVKLLFLSFISVFLLIACNDDPSSTGLGLITDKDKVQFSELDSYSTGMRQSSGYFEDEQNLGSSELLILGKNSYSESVVLMHFSIFLTDSLKTQLNNHEAFVRQVWMEMTPVYTLGDAANNFDFTVHKINSKWSSAGFDKDSLSSGSFSFDPTNVLISKTIDDTTFNFDIEPEVVQKWLEYHADTLSNPKYYGLLLKPTSGTQKMIGLKSLQSSDSETLPLIHVVMEKPSVYKDTISINPYMDIHVVTGEVSTDPNRIVLEGGLPIKGNLFFDLSSLTKDLIINKATLELTVDTVASIDGSAKSDSILARILKDSTAKSLTGDSLIATVIKRTGNVFSGDITWMVQRWAQGTVENQGILLELYDEDESTARISIYGTKEPQALLRPRLKIIYVKKNN